ncbi:MAG: hypothetical protein RLZZ301_880 [Bacteroidota bacterium]|jgi:uncharacterized protein (DUF1501 family)
MKRRSFLKNGALASMSLPFVSNGFSMQAIAKELFSVPKSAEDHVLIMIRMSGGNDGLNMVFPVDQYANLQIQRPSILIPEAQLLTLTNAVALHPKMTGMQTMFNEGKLSVIQNVGYPESNRSHFRSMDIWTSGSLDINQTSGWLGRYFDSQYPNFPEAYPNIDYPDPFAISMGSEVSTTCQGLMGNFSHAVNDPFNTSNLLLTPVVNDGTYYGSQIEYISTLINQTNEYGQQISASANAGNSLSSQYDPLNPLAVQLKYIAQLISGGLKTKVYILNVGGFDTHDSQVDQNDPKEGNHAKLLQQISDAVAAFQNDLQLLGIEERVAGFTFSEFGRQIAGNGSYGTDHGDAAPMLLFGACVSTGIIGSNPVIANQIDSQAGVPMQIDLRDVYASILKDWFEVPESSIQPLFEQSINFIDLLQGCSSGIGTQQDSPQKTALVYPNPSIAANTIRCYGANEQTHIFLINQEGKVLKEVYTGFLASGEHHLQIELPTLSPGIYFYLIRHVEAHELLRFVVS